MKIKFLSNTSDSYPNKLSDIHMNGRGIYLLGDLPPEEYSVAVVGTRKPTRYGKYATSVLVRELAELGIVIISGLALGIDGLAHTTSLKARGKTIAVLPCGLDKIYPATHRQLATDILANNGALVSEYPEGTPPLKQHFIARNRIVAGLADAVLIIEAAARSGTSTTAGFALDQGKTVMAVPGNIDSHMSKGTNNLIKAGAFPVTSVEDILQACNLKKLTNEKRYQADNQQEQTIIDLLEDRAMDGEMLHKLSGLSTSSFNRTLTMLEIKGAIHNQGSNIWHT